MILQGLIGRARRAGWRSFKALLVLGLIPVAMGAVELATYYYFIPLDLAEARNVGEEICLMAESGTLQNIRMGARFHTATSLGPDTAHALGAMASHLAHGCRVIVQPGDTRNLRSFYFGSVLLTITSTQPVWGNTPDAITIEMSRGAFLTYFVPGWDPGVSHDRAKFGFCCFTG